MFSVVLNKKVDKDKKDKFLNICREQELISFNASNRLWLLLLDEYKEEVFKIADDLNIRESISFEPANERKVKITFGKSGGNSSANTKIARIALPASWVKEMGVTEESSKVKLSFINNKIIIEKGEE